jgi:hypothetical protein
MHHQLLHILFSADLCPTRNLRLGRLVSFQTSSPRPTRTSPNILLSADSSTTENLHHHSHWPTHALPDVFLSADSCTTEHIPLGRLVYYTSTYPLANSCPIHHLPWVDPCPTTSCSRPTRVPPDVFDSADPCPTGHLQLGRLVSYQTSSTRPTRPLQSTYITLAIGQPMHYQTYSSRPTPLSHRSRHVRPFGRLVYYVIFSPRPTHVSHYILMCIIH